jgi:hypothetical protein
MSRLGSKLQHSEYGGVHSVSWFCPGCDCAHAIRVATPGAPHPVWSVRGTPEAPIFSPSVLVYFDAAGGRVTECHCFVGGSQGQCPGSIEFLADCPHALAGKTVPLPEWPAHYGFGGN